MRTSSKKRPVQKPPLITRAKIRELVENVRSAGNYLEIRAFKDALRAAHELGDLAPEVVSELARLKVLDTKFRHRPTALQAVVARLHDAKNDFLEGLEKNWKPFVHVLIRNFLEARRQADMLWGRLKAISGDEGEGARREYKFFAGMHHSYCTSIRTPGSHEAEARRFRLVGRFHGSNHMPTKIGSLRSSCGMPG